MYRFLTIIVLLVLVAACVKKNNTSPVPVLEFIDVADLRKATSASEPPRDTAVLVVGFSDGDGDLFVDNSGNDANMVVISKYYNADSSKFLIGNVDSKKLKQPEDGYYKGKAVQGKILVPLKEYRSSDKIKIIKFEMFMTDMKKNKSNTVSSPAYTLNF